MNCNRVQRALEARNHFEPKASALRLAAPRTRSTCWPGPAHSGQPARIPSTRHPLRGRQNVHVPPAFSPASSRPRPGANRASNRQRPQPRRPLAKLFEASAPLPLAACTRAAAMRVSMPLNRPSALAAAQGKLSEAEKEICAVHPGAIHHTHASCSYSCSDLFND
jgi:hypothetical protein